MNKDDTIYLAPGVPQVLNYKCKKCGTKYGRMPDDFCFGCGASNRKIKKIKPCNK